MDKNVQRKVGFVLFVMAAFFAGVSLLVWREVIALCVAGVLLLATAVFYATGQEEKSATPTEKTTEILLVDRMAELMRSNEKAEKGVYIAVKKQHEAMESGLAALTEKLEELIKAQENAVKTVVMYNKENAKQMALSEREELAQLREAFLSVGGKSDEGSLSPVTDSIREMSHRLYTEMHENSEAMLAELESTVDSLDEIKNILRVSGTGRMPAVSEEEDTMEEEIPEFLEETMEPEEDTNEPELSEGMLSPDDIAALFAEEEAEPAEEDKKSEDAVAPPDVDLSDPNRTLSPDDIAALVASLGH